MKMRFVLSFVILYFFYNTSFAQIEVYKGTIDNKYPIQVILYKTTDGKIAGYYFYEKYKNNIPVKGRFIKDDFLLCENTSTIIDFCDVFFSGKKQNDGTIIGSWKNKNANPSKIMSFSLSPAKVDSNLYKRLAENEKRSGFYGTDYEKFQVIYLFNQFFYIEMFLEEDNCDGSASIVADMTNTIYEDKNECNLTVSFKNDELIVGEKDCYLHGQHCSFRGTYKKK